MHKNKLAIEMASIASLLLLILTTILFVGIYRDREFDTLYLFLKAKPHFGLYYYSPLGEADPSNIPGTEGYLDEKGKAKEKEFIEVVETHHHFVTTHRTKIRE